MHVRVHVCMVYVNILTLGFMCIGMFVCACDCLRMRLNLLVCLCVLIKAYVQASMCVLTCCHFAYACACTCAFLCKCVWCRGRKLYVDACKCARLIVWIWGGWGWFTLFPFSLNFYITKLKGNSISLTSSHVGRSSPIKHTFTRTLTCQRLVSSQVYKGSICDTEYQCFHI